MTSTVSPTVADLVEVPVPRGGHVVVVSDIHLGDVPTPAATRATAALGAALASIEGHGLLVIAGDGFEMLACPPDIRAILDAHQDFVDAVRTFAAGQDHRVVVLPGNHDGQLAWDLDAVGVLIERLGADEIAMACDLVLDTGEGPQRIRIVHGNQADPFNAFVDVRAPLDTPLGHHVVREILPRIDPGEAPGALLEDIRWLNDTERIADFLASRLLYRKVAGRLWWVTIPFAAALLLRLIAFVPGVEDALRVGAGRWLLIVGLLVTFVLIVAAVAAGGTMLRVHRALAAATPDEGGGDTAHNITAREDAGRLIANDGYRGLITGHTHIPELSVVGHGFYANTGCGIRSVVPRPSRFGLPAAFTPVRRCSRVELTAGATMEVRLVTGDEPMRSPVLLERLVTRPDHGVPVDPSVVASLPDGGTWPIAATRFGEWVGRRRVRRFAAGFVFAFGMLNIVSVFVRPLRENKIVDDISPFTVHPVAGVGAVLVGLALIGLARGIRLGRRRAWWVTIALLAIAAIGHVLKGGGVEETTLGLLLTAWLVLERHHFRVAPMGRGRVIAVAVFGGLFAVALTIGLGLVDLADDSLTRPAIALAIGVVALLVVAVGRFAAPAPDDPEAIEQAQAIVGAHATNPRDRRTLDAGNQLLFTGDSVVAYTVHGGVMAVFPDPVGPPQDRADVWADVMDRADTYGWSVMVPAAAATWLPVYRAAGLVDAYLGEELTIDTAAIVPPVHGDGVEITEDGDTLTAVAAGRTHVHEWVPTIDGYQLVRADGDQQAADAVVAGTAAWMRTHGGKLLVVGPPALSAGRLDARWATAPGASVATRSRVEGLALRGRPRRRKRIGEQAGALGVAR